MAPDLDDGHSWLKSGTGSARPMDDDLPVDKESIELNSPKVERIARKLAKQQVTLLDQASPAQHIAEPSTSPEMTIPSCLIIH